MMATMPPVTNPPSVEELQSQSVGISNRKVGARGYYPSGGAPSSAEEAGVREEESKESEPKPSYYPTEGESEEIIPSGTFSRARAIEKAKKEHPPEPKKGKKKEEKAKAGPRGYYPSGGAPSSPSEAGVKAPKKTQAEKDIEVSRAAEQPRKPPSAKALINKEREIARQEQVFGSQQRNVESLLDKARKASWATVTTTDEGVKNIELNPQTPSERKEAREWRERYNREVRELKKEASELNKNVTELNKARQKIVDSLRRQDILEKTESGWLRLKDVSNLTEQQINSLQKLGFDEEKVRKISRLQRAEENGLIDKVIGPTAGKRGYYPSGEKYVLSKPLGEYSEKEYEKYVKPIFGVSREKYEKGKALEKAKDWGLVEKTDEGKYKLTKSPSELSMEEEKTVEKAFGKKFGKGPSRLLYEWGEKSFKEGSWESELTEYTSALVGTATEPYRGIASLIPWKLPGEGQQVVSYKTLPEVEPLTAGQKVGMYLGAGGVMAGEIALAGAGAGVAGGFAEQAAYDIPVVGETLESGAGTISSVTASHPTATMVGATAPIVGMEGWNVYSKYEQGEPVSEIIGEEAVRIAGILGGAYGFSKGFPKGKGLYHKLKTQLKGGTIIGEESVPEYVIDAEAQDDFPALRAEGYSERQIANMSDEEIKAAYRRMANKYASPEMRMTEEGIPSWHGTASSEITPGEEYTVEELASRHAWIRNEAGEMVPTSQATEEQIASALERGEVYGGQFFAPAPSIHFTRTGVTSEGAPRPGIPSLGKPKFVYSEFPSLEYTGLSKGGPRFAQKLSEYEGTGTLVMPGSQALETEAVLSGGTEMVPVEGGPYALEAGGTTIPIGRYLPRTVAESAGVPFTEEGAVSLESLASSYTATEGTFYPPMLFGGGVSTEGVSSEAFKPTKPVEMTTEEISEKYDISESKASEVASELSSRLSSGEPISRGSIERISEETEVPSSNVEEISRKYERSRPLDISSIIGGYAKSYVSPFEQTTTETYERPTRISEYIGYSGTYTSPFEEVETTTEGVTKPVIPQKKKQRKKPKRKQELGELFRRRYFHPGSITWWPRPRRERKRKEKKKSTRRKRPRRRSPFGGKPLTESLRESKKKPKKKKKSKKKKGSDVFGGEPLTEGLL